MSSMRSASSRTRIADAASETSAPLDEVLRAGRASRRGCGRPWRACLLPRAARRRRRRRREALRPRRAGASSSATWARARASGRARARTARRRRARVRSTIGSAEGERLARAGRRLRQDVAARRARPGGRAPGSGTGRGCRARRATAQLRRSRRARGKNARTYCSTPCFGFEIADSKPPEGGTRSSSHEPASCRPLVSTVTRLRGTPSPPLVLGNRQNRGQTPIRSQPEQTFVQFPGRCHDARVSLQRRRLSATGGSDPGLCVG